jgi:hypothetical protein
MDFLLDLAPGKYYLYCHVCRKICFILPIRQLVHRDRSPWMMRISIGQCGGRKRALDPEKLM